MEHREGKEAQRVTVVALVDCLFFLFPKMKEREKEIEEIRLVLHPMFLYI